ALIGAVLHGARVAAWIAGWAMLVVYLTAQILVPRGPGPDWGGLVGSVAWLLVILLVAEALRFRRERAAAAERARQQQARALADEERLRIARELHDVLAHNISMINIQAGVALHLGGELPEQARGALQAIKEASRDTLRELRATLGVLRQVDEDAPRAPAPSLSRLDDLVARTSASSLSVHKEITGAVRTIPTGTDLAAYRIIQEALTNVHRHANATNAWVRVDHADEALTVTVEDDGRGAEFDDGSGAGIAGMRERAAALGGTLETGHRLAGGFRVRATLPLPPDESPGTGQGPAERSLDPATDPPPDDTPVTSPRDTDDSR
ncbi:MAG: sensor histidine kinase, partial [Micromonosporaceae bacterium]